MNKAPKRGTWSTRLWSPEAVLLVAVLLLGLMFVITEFSVGFYRTKREDLAQLWFARGDHSLQANDPKEAIEDLRNALSYDPDNSVYQLRLAQALAASRRVDEAEYYLFDLWARQPGSGEINLELARLEAQKNSADAARYYDNAIYGVWEGDPAERRWQTRMELFRYWQSRGNVGQAQAELLSLAAVTPAEDYQKHAEIGRLQLESGDARQALAQFRVALKAKERFPDALDGAGEAEFAIGDYPSAISYLQATVRLEPGNQGAARNLAVAKMVIADDPFALGIRDAERVRRTIAAFRQTQALLPVCAYRKGIDLETDDPQDNLQRAWAQARQLEPWLRKLRRQPDNVLKVMNFAFSVENMAATTCGPLKGKDQALWLIGKRHQWAETNTPGS